MPRLPEPWVHRVLRWRMWPRTERAWLYLHAADEMLIAVAPAPVVLGRLPELMSRAKQQLPPDDPRMAAMLAIYDEFGPRRATLAPHIDEPEHPRPLGDVERRTLASVLHGTYSSSDRGYARARSFRNILVLATALLGLAAGLLIGVGAAWPHVLPLCVTTGATSATGTGTTGTAGAAKILVCPTG
ncbi:MAG: hypothetical protein ACQSGP_27780, partial [Frankia sp.]